MNSQRIPSEVALTQASYGIRQELQTSPQPLILGSENLGIIWSAKSACTSVVLWYLARCNLLQAARFYSHWPHNFRNDVLYKSTTYKSWLRECDIDRMQWIKVIRNPFRRTVSSFRHALNHGYENTKIKKIIGVDVDSRGLSFSQFLEYLSRIDITHCNIHHRCQYHPIENIIPSPDLISVDEGSLFDSLETAAQGTGLSALTNSSREALENEAKRIASTHRSRLTNTEEDCSTRSFSPEEAAKNWPTYKQFLNEETRAHIASIYIQDADIFARPRIELNDAASNIS